MAKVAETIGGLALIGFGIAADVASLGAVTPFLPMIFSAGATLTLAGIGGLIAGNPQPGVAVAGANPIGAWNYPVGTVKVGGVKVFDTTNSSQGASNDKQLHRVYALAACQCAGGNTAALRLDGQVLPATYYYNPTTGADQYVSYTPTQSYVNIVSVSRVGGLVTITTSGSFAIPASGQTLWLQNVPDNTFNGLFICAQTGPNTFTCTNGGPDTTAYGGRLWTALPNYADKVYFEFQFGAQTQTFAGLLASGTQWTTTDLWKGRTVAYTRFGYDSTVFSGGIPLASFVLNGCAEIYDPRTGTTGWTQNAALITAWFMSLPPQRGGFGLPIGTGLAGLYIDQAQLIVAANICDEEVELAAGGTQPRYTCNMNIMLSKTRGAILSELLSTMGGRITREGGAYKIFPAAWPGSTFSATIADLRGPIQFKPLMSARDISNGVKGVYISPANNYQQADIPPYAQDVLHGYASDANQAMDGGDRIWKEVQLSGTDNAPMAQRLCKIDLKRTRYQLRCTVRLSMRAYSVIAQDVIDITMARYNWVNKYFEVLNSRLVMEKEDGASAPSLCVELDLAETGADVYDWFTTEELSVQGYVSPAQVNTLVCPYPEFLSIYSGPGATVDGITYPSTISTTKSGLSINGLYCTWLAPNDGYVINGGSIEVQYRKSTDSAWTPFGSFSPSVTSCIIPHLSDGDIYYVQVRATNCAGTPSQWVDAGPEKISSTLSLIAYSGVQVAPDGVLTAFPFSDGTAEIDIAVFTANIASQSAVCTPAVSAIDGLLQGRTYAVYYVDPYFAGGAITPIATLDTADFLNKAGYFLIGYILTPIYTGGGGGGGGGTRYPPSTANVPGGSPLPAGGNAFDGDLSTYATILGKWFGTRGFGSTGTCAFSGWGVYTAPAAMTLHVSAAIIMDGGTGITCTVTLFSAGDVLSTTTGVSIADHVLTVPAGTDLSTLTLTVTADGTTGYGSTNITASMQIYEIYIV